MGWAIKNRICVELFVGERLWLCAQDAQRRCGKTLCGKTLLIAPTAGAARDKSCLPYAGFFDRAPGTHPPTSCLLFVSCLQVAARKIATTRARFRARALSCRGAARSNLRFAIRARSFGLTPSFPTFPATSKTKENKVSYESSGLRGPRTQLLRSTLPQQVRRRK